LDRFDENRPLRPWLLSIAANLSRNRRRSISRYLAAAQRLLHVEGQAGARNSGAEKSIEEHTQAHIDQESLWQAVQRLKYADQQVIYLRYFLELSVEETAQAAGIPQGTVKSRLHRALSHLREVIVQDFPGLREGWQG
jgi:RNA polymerase sigma-70 factor (ECF subfamily)